MLSEDEKLSYFTNLITSMDEVQRRRAAGLRALEYGWGGISYISKITGMSRSTIRKGIKEIKSGKLERPARLRKKGGGRKKIKDKNPQVMKDLETIMEDITGGNPMSAVKWTSKSTYKIAEKLTAKGHKISEDTVGRLLKENNYSLQSNKKRNEGKSKPERDAQFRYINKLTKGFMKRKQPIISVDAKKKELVGNFKNPGQTWRKKGEPEEVNIYDFPQLAEGKAIPYGAYDIALNKGFVNVGITSDTAEFAVESIRQWWKQLGQKHYSKAKEILICADSGGSNGYRNRGWKYFLHIFAKEIGLTITVCHFPPATSKWNKIEHRLFSFISKNWKGKPLITYQVIINFIKHTTTKTGLEVFARLDRRKYKKGRKFSDDEMAKIKLEKHSFHPQWNYTIYPKEVRIG